MNAHLMRVLQRGGMASQIGQDRWGVWRGRDRRARRVGVMTSTEIDLLRLRGMLQSWGDDTPPILVCGASVLAAPSATPSAKRLIQARSSRRAPLIELMVTHCRDRALRNLICETGQRYRADLACAAHAGAAGGMNWDGLALGGRIDGGKGPQTFSVSYLAVRAQSCLRIVQAELGDETVYLLDRLILGEETRAGLARRLGIRPSLVEGRAIAAMRALHEVYALKVKAGA